MAKKKKGSIINRLIMGSEKSEDYARSTLPTNRWELFWDIFKGRFGKLFVLNLLMFLFALPLIALILFRVISLMNLGGNYPFTQCFGVGYLSAVTVNGYAEAIVFQTDLIVYLAMPIVLSVFAIGLSGGAYVMRNIVWTEGIFVANDFWKGIKQNIKQMLLICLTFSMVFYITMITISFCEQNVAAGSNIKWLFILCEVLSYIILVFYSIMTFHMITMSVTYDTTFLGLLNNSFLLTVSLAPQGLFFLAVAILPYLFFTFGNLFLVIAFIFLLVIGLSYSLLVWTNFSQWIYDRFINEKLGFKKNRGIYEKVKASDAGAIKKYKEQLVIASRNSLNSRPIKPITDDLELAELPLNFSRADLERLRASKQAIYDDHAKYVDEHKDDEQFKPTEAELKLQELDKEKQKRIEKAKKALSKHNKKYR